MNRNLGVGALVLVIALPGAASADACRDEIAGLFAEGGAMDPFARPPHRQTVREMDEDGVEKRTMLNVFETPMRTIAGSPAESYFTMAIERDLWNGPSVKGPWTGLGYQMPEGRDAAMRLGVQQNAANLVDTDCPGAEADGSVRFSFRTQTDRDKDGTFFGAFYTIWIDPAENHAVRIDMTDFVNSWSEGISKDRHEIMLEYDPSIRVMPPG